MLNFILFKYANLVCFVSVLLFVNENVCAQQVFKLKNNNIGFTQSVVNFGGKRIHYSFKSNSINYTRFFNNFGVGLDLNRLQMKKNGLTPIMPYEEWGRKDNLQLYYANILFSYRFVNFCPIKNLNLKIDFAPTFLIGGQNSFYGEIDSYTLQHNSYWKNPSRMEYQTKFNIYGRIGVNYMLFDKIEIGIAISSYLKFIAPTLMSLPFPFSPGPQQINKSSFQSLSLKYNF